MNKVDGEQNEYGNVKNGQEVGTVPNSPNPNNKMGGKLAVDGEFNLIPLLRVYQGFQNYNRSMSLIN